MLSLKESPIFIGATALIGFLATISEIWSLFSAKPAAQSLLEFIKMTPIVAVLGLVSVAVFMIMLLTLYYAWTRPLFYESRVQLEKERGGLRRELSSQGESFWAMWPAGHIVQDLDDSSLRKIKRLVIGSPDVDRKTLELYTQHTHSGTVEHTRGVIAQALLRAKAAEVPVKLSEERNVSLVIANPDGEDRRGWARMEFIMPFMKGPSRPSTVITEKRQPKLFRTIVDSFEEIWRESVSPQK